MDTSIVQPLIIGLLSGLVFVLLVLLLCSIVVVKQQTSVIIERLGKYRTTFTPGLHFIIPIIDRVAYKAPLRIQQLECAVETKTKDNVFVTIPVVIQYQIVDVYKSFYTLSNHQEQIRAYIFDVVRTSLSSLVLDDAFANKDTIANSVEEALKERMENYGFLIINSLVTDINPDQKVKDAMNEINAAQRQREAAISLAEADKIKIVKQAEADAESKRLQGEGIANQRKAIVEGLVEQFKMMAEAGVEKEAENILMLTQYFDTLQEVSKNSETKTLMLPSNPGGVGAVMSELRNSLILNKEL